ncbi:uncharacterized protein LOC123679106 isoform X2 [Harmonia axyridis]|uniref:uncharacterized protein LOC123679106 isoform X2 n=1 Tax=Harmonia axyridis TaxID=115357 RepID=UPI001E277DBA|nr:uncharacterized protein LOC123679106 isoform X2 [Harmonia axyridis]
MWARGRNGKISMEQKMVLLDYLSNHYKMICGKFSQNFNHKIARQYWQELSDILNAIPGGAKKDWHQWRKTWHDMRTKTKSKNAAIKKHKEGIGGGAYFKEQLTPSENKILQMICTTSVEGHNYVEESLIAFDNDFCNTDNAGASDSSFSISEMKCEVSEELPPLFQQVPPKKEKCEMENLYYKEKIKLLKHKVHLKERQVNALERIAICMESIVGSKNLFARGLRLFVHGSTE